MIQEPLMAFGTHFYLDHELKTTRAIDISNGLVDLDIKRVILCNTLQELTLINIYRFFVRSLKSWKKIRAKMCQ